MTRSQKLLSGFLLLGATLLGEAGILSAQEVPLKIGDVILQDNFEKNNFSRLEAAHRDKNVMTITAETGQGGSGEQALARDVLGQDSKAAAKRDYTMTRGVMREFQRAKGYLIEVSAEVKADVPRQAKPWEGIRFAINYATDVTNHADCRYGLYGTFDWKPVSFTTRIPTGCQDASMTIGIIGENGTASFRNISVKVVGLPRSVYFAKNAEKKPYKGHSLERLRGFNSQSWTVKGPHLRNMKKKWNCNIVTGTMELPPEPLRGKELDAWLEKNVYPTWDLANAKAADSGIYFMFQFSSGHWRDEKSFERSDYFYYKPEYADSLVEIWSKIARRYKGQKYIYGFQLLNESAMRIAKQPGCPDYEEMMERIALAINEIDPERTIVVQPEQYWGMRAFDKLRPLNAKNVVYAPHFYMPFPYTHQGIGGNKNEVSYPGKVGQIFWDKETFRKDLQSARDFQKAYNAHMIVTEFSAVAGAPNREKWVQDAIDLFEEYDWDWTFHAENEWYGWSPEYQKSKYWTPEDWSAERSWERVPDGTPTSQMMKLYFDKNQFLPVIPTKMEESTPVNSSARKLPVDLNYPENAARRAGYIYGKDLTFEPGDGIERAGWLQKETPTTFLAFDRPYRSGEWEPFEFSFKVNGSGNAVLVFQSGNSQDSKTKQQIPTWSCYRDLEVQVNGHTVIPAGFDKFRKNGQPEFWNSMGALLKTKQGNAVLSAQKFHLYASIPVKDGDTVSVKGFARGAAKTDLDAMVVFN